MPSFAKLINGNASCTPNRLLDIIHPVGQFIDDLVKAIFICLVTEYVRVLLLVIDVAFTDGNDPAMQLAALGDAGASPFQE